MLTNPDFLLLCRFDGISPSFGLGAGAHFVRKTAPFCWAHCRSIQFHSGQPVGWLQNVRQLTHQNREHWKERPRPPIQIRRQDQVRRGKLVTDEGLKFFTDNDSWNGYLLTYSWLLFDSLPDKHSLSRKEWRPKSPSTTSTRTPSSSMTPFRLITTGSLKLAHLKSVLSQGCSQTTWSKTQVPNTTPRTNQN